MRYTHVAVYFMLTTYVESAPVTYTTHQDNGTIRSSSNHSNPCATCAHPSNNMCVAWNSMCYAGQMLCSSDGNGTNCYVPVVSTVVPTVVLFETSFSEMLAGTGKRARTRAAWRRYGRRSEYRSALREYRHRRIAADNDRARVNDTRRGPKVGPDVSDASPSPSPDANWFINEGSSEHELLREGDESAAEAELAETD